MFCEPADPNLLFVPFSLTLKMAVGSKNPPAGLGFSAGGFVLRGIVTALWTETGGGGGGGGAPGSN